jgi:probable F420-dependent oxidoreductase
MSRLGLELPRSLSISEQVELASWAETEGYDDVWAPELGDPDAFVALALVAQATSRVRIGTAIVPMATRTVPVIAAAAASLTEASDGRFALGLGVSTPMIIERWSGLSRSSPIALSRETIELLRHLLAGGRSDHEGEYVRSKGFRLERAPVTPPPVLLAAVNVKMLELAGEIADGVLLNMVPIERVGAVIEAVSRGAERAGRDRLPELLMQIVTEVNDDEDAARDRIARLFAFYLAAPPYQRALRWHGFDDEVERAREAVISRDLERVRAGISPEFVSSFGVFGPFERCRERYEAYWAAGIDELTPTIPPSADPRSTYESFAELARADV